MSFSHVIYSSSLLFINYFKMSKIFLVHCCTQKGNRRLPEFLNKVWSTKPKIFALALYRKMLPTPGVKFNTTELLVVNGDQPDDPAALWARITCSYPLSGCRRMGPTIWGEGQVKDQKKKEVRKHDDGLVPLEGSPW